MPKHASRPRVRPAPAARPQQRIHGYATWAICALLLVAIGVIYGQTLGHKLLIYDDPGFVAENPHVRDGLTGPGLWWALTDGPYGDWYPMAMLSHMLDCQLFGLSAWGHHLVNVLLHAATTIVLFMAVWRMTNQCWPSALVAGLFAIHPQHVESVAWISERRDVLSGLFFVLTLWAYLGYVQCGRAAWHYLLVAALFTLGLMSKPMLVTLPPLLLLIDYWPLCRFGEPCDAAGGPSAQARSAARTSLARLALEKLPLAALAVGICSVTFWRKAGGSSPLDWTQRFAGAATSPIGYIADLFYPENLLAFYRYPAGGFAGWKVAAAIALLAAVSTAVAAWRRRFPYLFVGWFWYLGMLVPVLGLITISTHARADRYMYLPGIGLYLALAFGGARLAASWPARRWIFATAAGAALAALVACSVRQASFWRDDETLWRHTLACDPDNGRAEFALADLLARQGRTDEAIDFFRRSESHPTDAAPFSNLGAILAGQGHFDEAIWHYRQAIAIQPDSYAARANLGLALLQMGQPAEAKEHFCAALALHPRGLEARVGLAHVLSAEGNFNEARSEFERALAVDPNFSPAHLGLAQMLNTAGEPREAATHYWRVLQIEPDNRLARRGLDGVLSRVR